MTSIDEARLVFRADTALGTTADESAWDELPSLSKVGRLFSSPEWSRMVTKSDGEAPTYFRLYDGDRLVAGVTGDVMPPGIPPQYDVEGMLRGNFIKTDLPTWEPPAPMMPCLTVVTRAGRAADFRVSPAFERADRVRLLRALIRHIEQYGETEGAVSTALLFTPHEASELVEAVSDRYVGASVSKSFYLDVDFGSLEEYFEQFDSKRRRVYRAERRKVTDTPGVELRVLPLADRMDEAARLGALNFAKYGQVDLADVAAIRSRNELIVDVLGSDARVMELLVDGELVASLQFNLHQHVYYARLVGILDSAPKPLAAYFNMVFYGLIDNALAEGVERIVYAQELASAKLSRGCRFETQDLWIRTDDPLVAERVKALHSAVDQFTSITG
jgi:CelD/BcsL family acetyltransferase involved in cellulose biosynthesis